MTFSFKEYLQSFQNLESILEKTSPQDFDLKRTYQLLEIFRHPEDRLKFAHIAGSKGKGSTCAFLASILRASGYRVGLYTSPHLHSPLERIRILEPGAVPSAFEGMAQEEELASLLEFYKDDIDRLRAEGAAITFYELWTALAILYFARNNVDVVVLETGLGGRLDSTNAVDTLVCGITPISLEHARILGHTLEAIALEKAGIIKSPAQKVVLAPQAPEVMAVLRARCGQLFIAPDEVGTGVTFTVTGRTPKGFGLNIVGRRDYGELSAGLAGDHQAVNAATAVGLAEALEMYGFVLSVEAVREGLARVVWPARFETFAGSPAVILDCAHTPESAHALAATVRQVYPGKCVTLVLGVSSDKDVHRISGALEPVVGAAVLTQSGHPRAFDFRAVDAGGLFPGRTVVVTADVRSAMREAATVAGADGIILVCGSVFVCGEARSYVPIQRF